jgi:putative ABC transport system permease protein
MFARVRALVHALTARRAFEAGLTEELRFHIEQYTEDLVRSGVSPEEARRRARMELGGINTVKEECREARGLGGAMRSNVSAAMPPVSYGGTPASLVRSS